MSRIIRKPVFGVADQVRHKPGCRATNDCYEMLEISNYESSRDCTIFVAKAKTLISCAVTRFYNDTAHMLFLYNWCRIVESQSESEVLSTFTF